MLIAESFLTNSMTLLIGGVLLVLLAYAISRAVSFAHFRTKLEYLRSVLKELHGGDKNG